MIINTTAHCEVCNCLIEDAQEPYCDECHIYHLESLLESKVWLCVQEPSTAARLRAKLESLKSARS